MKLPLALVFAAAVLAVCGIRCAMLKPYRYNVLWENHSAVQLKDVRISYGSFSTTFGGHLWVTEPLTDSVKVEFRTPDGKLHQRQVGIPEEMRRNIRLADLMFFIEPDLSVSVHLRSLEETNRAAGM